MAQRVRVELTCRFRDGSLASCCNTFMRPLHKKHLLFLLNNKLDYRTQDFTILIYNVGALATRNGFEPSKFLLERQVTLPVCLTGHKWWMRKDSNFRCIQRHRFTVCCLRRLATHPYGISGRIRTYDNIRMKDAY